MMHIIHPCNDAHYPGGADSYVAQMAWEQITDTDIPTAWDGARYNMDLAMSTEHWAEQTQTEPSEDEAKEYLNLTIFVA